ncbi:hypothetical protein ACLB2K_059921 [Fragaria x ananassa]
MVNWRWGLNKWVGESNKMLVIPGEALKEAVPAADKVLAGSIHIMEKVTLDVNEVICNKISQEINVSTMVATASVAKAMTPHVKASEQVVQDIKCDNVPLREWMSKTNVKMAGKENLKPITREVGEVVKHPRSPLKELADNVVVATTSGKKSRANPLPCKCAWPHSRP